MVSDTLAASLSSTLTGIPAIGSGTSTLGSWTTHGMLVTGLPPETPGFPRYYIGVLVSSCFFHPPTIRPSSWVCSENKMYFLLSRARISQAIRRRNFKISVFLIAVSIVGSLLSIF